MPESKRRKNRGGKRSRNRAEEAAQKKSPLNDADPMDLDDLELEDETLPTWYRATMFGLMLLGLLWIIVWYISGQVLPLPDAGNWNMGIGFGLAMIGFLMTMKWK